MISAVKVAGGAPFEVRKYAVSARLTLFVKGAGFDRPSQPRAELLLPYLELKTENLQPLLPPRLLIHTIPSIVTSRI